MRTGQPVAGGSRYETGGRLRAAIALKVQEYKRSTAQDLKNSENAAGSQRNSRRLNLLSYSTSCLLINECSHPEIL